MFLNFDSVSPTDNSLATGIPLATRAPVALGVSFSLHFVALVFVFAQVLVKGKLGKLGVDDALVSIASIIALSLLIFTSTACDYGFGLHTADIRPEWILPFGKFSYISVALATICFAVTKAAMLCFFLRFAVNSRFRLICHLSITFMVLSTMATLLVNLFGCKPISGGWDRRQSHPSVCITTTPFYIYSTVSQLILDLLLLVLPIQLVVGLRMGWVVKLGLVAMFSMGFLFVNPVYCSLQALIKSRIAAVSAVTLWKMIVAIDGGDILWDGAFSWMWTMAELNVGIMTTCMPGMKMFVSWVRGVDGVVRVVVVEHNTIGGGPRGRRNIFPRKESESMSRLSRGHVIEDKTGMELENGSSESVG